MKAVNLQRTFYNFQSLKLEECLTGNCKIRKSFCYQLKNVNSDVKKLKLVYRNTVHRTAQLMQCCSLKTNAMKPMYEL